MSERAYVALGSNLGDRAARLQAATETLRATPGVTALCCSSVYETAPVGPPGQGPYLNAVVCFETSLAPTQLLGLLHEIERSAGRTRSGTRNEARTLDLDLLLYGDREIDEPSLRVPHPRLHERAFVLVPLCDLAPQLRHPALGQTMESLAARALDPALGDVLEVRPWPGSRSNPAD